MKVTIKKSNLYFYSVLALAAILITGIIQLNQTLSNGNIALEGFEQRVIRCQVPINEELVQNLYYMAESLQEAKQLLFNSKNGLMFDNSLYIKTTDFDGNNHVVALKDIDCDSVGSQVLSSDLDEDTSAI